jgi:hypothetical protein
MFLINETNAELADINNLDPDGDFLGEEGLGDEGLEGHEGHHGLHEEDKELTDLLGELSLADDQEVQVDPTVLAKLPPEAKVTVASYDSLQGRAYLRAKLAADATGKEEDGEIESAEKLKWSDMLEAADKHTDGQTKLEVKPSDDLGYIETLPEINKRMLEVARMPPKVRKEAEAIQKMVTEGKLDPRDVDELVAQGLDKDAVSYWKKFYGEVEGGSEFASELVKEHVKASMESDLKTFQVKMARAFELTYQMVDRGLCPSDRGAITNQVDSIMNMNEEGFDSLKRVTARHEPSFRKEAGRIPQVGLRGDSEGNSVSTLVEEDAFAELSKQFGTRRGSF